MCNPTCNCKDNINTMGVRPIIEHLQQYFMSMCRTLDVDPVEVQALHAAHHTGPRDKIPFIKALRAVPLGTNEQIMVDHLESLGFQVTRPTPKVRMDLKGAKDLAELFLMLHALGRVPTQIPVPATTDWIEWHGGEMPVLAGTQVAVRHRDGVEFEGPAGEGCATLWDHRDNFTDIVAYRVLKSA